MNSEMKSMVNYWFRHVWEYFIPLYPAIILASQILAVPVGKISAILFWYFFIVVTIGFWLVIRKIPNPEELLPVSAVINKKEAFINLLAGIWPVIVIVLLVLLFHLDVGLTVTIIMLILLIANRYRLEELKSLWKESFKISLIYLIAGVLLFKEMLQISGVVEWLPGYLRGFGIPDFFVVISLTFIVAFAVGISQAYVAAAFPLLIGIIGHGAGLKPGMLVLAYISGFIGVMLSPVHLCFVLTVDFFKADFLKVWRALLLPEAVVLLTAILFAIFWK